MEGPDESEPEPAVQPHGRRIRERDPGDHALDVLVLQGIEQGGVQARADPVPFAPGAAVLQSRINLSAAAIRATYGTDPAVPGLAYGLHLHPSTLGDPVALQTALQQFSAVISAGDNEFYAVHIHFTDLGSVTSSGGVAIEAAREFVREASRIAGDAGMFAWVSDTGAIGPSVLDEGTAFTAYHPGLTPRKLYVDSAATPLDAQCGKVLQIWAYDL